MVTVAVAVVVTVAVAVVVTVAVATAVAVAVAGELEALERGLEVGDELVALGLRQVVSLLNAGLCGGKRVLIRLPAIRRVLRAVGERARDQLGQLRAGVLEHRALQGGLDRGLELLDLIDRQALGRSQGLLSLRDGAGERGLGVGGPGAGVLLLGGVDRRLQGGQVVRAHTRHGAEQIHLGELGLGALGPLEHDVLHGRVLSERALGGVGQAKAELLEDLIVDAQLDRRGLGVGVVGVEHRLDRHVARLAVGNNANAHIRRAIGRERCGHVVSERTGLGALRCPRGE